MFHNAFHPRDGIELNENSADGIVGGVGMKEERLVKIRIES
jgi:hypothetical protein